MEIVFLLSQQNNHFKKSDMKTFYILFLSLVVGIFSIEVSYAQCTPGDSISCPDPENNGQICPEVLPDAEVNQMYDQDFTILVPLEYVLDSASGTTITLDHVKIAEVGNLPDGITWATNAEDSIYLPQVYYCVNLAGTPSDTGFYPLKITIDVYALVFGTPVYVGTVTDSTSLTLKVVGEIGIDEFESSSLTVRGAVPNPFTTKLDVIYSVRNQGIINFELFDIVGNSIFKADKFSKTGENHFLYDGTGLKPGLYFYTISSLQNSYTGKIIKTE
jgi:hypothetical protein